MAEKIIAVPLLKLKFDHRFYPRREIDSYNVTLLADALRAGVKIPPITVGAQSFIVVDGWHRARAYEHVYGKETEISAIVRHYSTDADLFEDAVRLNAHGKQLGAADRAHCALQAATLGLEMDRLALALAMTTDRYRSLTERKLGEMVGGRPLVVKRTLEWLSAEGPLTPAQADANEKSGGMRTLFYVNQVINLLEADAINENDEKLARRLNDLTLCLTKKGYGILVTAS